MFQGRKNMKIFNTGGAMLASLFVGVAMLSVGCGSSSSGTNGTGGVSGGTGGGGGAMAGATGGSSGTGGAGGAVVPTLSYTFDTGLQGFALSTYAEPAPRNNLAGIYDAGTSPGGPTLEFDSSVSDPAGGGSLKVTATFTAYGQYVDPIINLPAPGRDLSGKTLHARLQFTSGTFAGGAQLHVTTGTSFGGYGKGDFTSLIMGTWSTATMVLNTTPSSTPEALNPAIVMQVGVQIFSGDAMLAGTPLLVPQMAVFNIDTITD
jgi:hypothetical protein